MNKKNLTYKIIPVIIFLLISCGKEYIKSKPVQRGVSGTAIYNREPLSGISVFAYRDFLSNLNGNDYISCFESTDSSGNFKIALPAGTYIITARGTNNGDDYFCYYGGNPVSISDSAETTLRLNMTKKTSWLVVDSKNADAKDPGVYGAVLYKNQLLPEAQIKAFLNTETYFRGPGFAETSADSSGNFSLNLPAGTYYIVAHKRNCPDDIGPIKPGDYFGYYENNPIEIKKSTIPVFINTIIKEKSSSSGSIITASGTFTEEGFYIEGKIIDTAGKPVEGMYAGLYKDSNMIEKPLFLSEMTDKRGIFKIHVNVSGKYFLGARSNLKKPPKENEYLGWYTGTPDHSIDILSNEKKEGVIIVTEPVPSSGE